MDKLFIQADALLRDSFNLAWQVYESGYWSRAVSTYCQPTMEEFAKGETSALR